AAGVHLSSPPDRHPSIAAEAFRRGGGADPHQEDAARGPVQRLEEHRPVWLARKPFRPRHLCQAAPRGAIHIRDLPLKGAGLGDGKREEVTGGLLGRRVGKREAHGNLLVEWVCAAAQWLTPPAQPPGGRPATLYCSRSGGGEEGGPGRCNGLGPGT